MFRIHLSTSFAGDELAIPRAFRECLLTHWPQYKNTTIGITKGDDLDGKSIYYLFSGNLKGRDFQSDSAQALKCVEEKLKIPHGSIEISEGQFE